MTIIQAVEKLHAIPEHRGGGAETAMRVLYGLPVEDVRIAAVVREVEAARRHEPMAHVEECVGL